MRLFRAGKETRPADASARRCCFIRPDRRDGRERERRRILTGLDDALVLDIGGTTTDCAIIENGHVAVSADGARVGNG